MQRNLGNPEPLEPNERHGEASGLHSSIPEPASREREPARAGLSPVDVTIAWLGLAILAATVLEVLFKPFSGLGFRGFTLDTSYRSFTRRFDVILAGIFAAAFCLVPIFRVVIDRARRHWRTAYTYASLALICVFLVWFLIHFGRRQFGAWDFNILIDTGWRQILGQRPYVDFVTPNPPGFNLGAKWAFELFGISWNANLYFNAVFACATFLWMYWLMLVLRLGTLPAMAMAFAIECAGMLTLCFWWYNSSTLTLAAVFFLSCLAYASKPRAIGVQISYVISLAILSLMKPNIAGVLMLGGVVLLFIATDRKMRLLLLTLAAASVALLVLVANHVSISAMLASYLGVAKERGSIGARLAYHAMAVEDRHAALLWIVVLSIPLLGLVPRAIQGLARKNWRDLALSLLYPLTLVVALYGLMTNGEYRDVECTVLLAAGAALSFAPGGNGPLLRRVYVAIMCATIMGDMYYGAARVRVFGIGDRMYFDWRNSGNRIDSGFLKDLQAGPRIVETQREVEEAIRDNPGPVFLGPRLEYDYAVFDLPSPEHFPVYWQPGVSFGRSEQSHLVQMWKDTGFKTLIFQRFDGLPRKPGGTSNDYTAYTDEFFQAIDQGYILDDHYGFITVYHRRQP